MKNGGIEEVRAILDAEPEAASQFFFDFGFEPVVCFAVRSGCAPEVLHLLLQHGADATACEISGYSPLTCLAMLPSLAKKKVPERVGVLPVVLPVALVACAKNLHGEHKLQQVRQRVTLARLLLEAGVAVDMLDERGRSPVEVAKAAGNMELAYFLENYLEVQSCVAMLRAQGSSSPVGGLSGDLLQAILGYVLPSKLVIQSDSYVSGE